MDQDKIIKVKIVENPLWQKILSHPFKYWRRATGFTFCLVALSNFTTTIFDKDRRNLMLDFPQFYFFGLLWKSTKYGVIFPAFYIKAIREPRTAFIYANDIGDFFK